VLCIFLTPFNLQFWGSLYPPTSEILQKVNINPFDVFETIVIILGIPLILGMLTNHWRPKTAALFSKVLKPLSITIFVAFVVIAFTKNYDLFTEYVHLVVIIVFFHNAIALFSGYTIGRLGNLSLPDRRTLAVETGIQNSGLGLLLIFTFFDGLGGMAIVAGWWGIWHIISGLSIAYIWARKKNIATAI
jgi:BASS family bile acid:Na+ symporter